MHLFYVRCNERARPRIPRLHLHHMRIHLNSNDLLCCFARRNCCIAKTCACIKDHAFWLISLNALDKIPFMEWRCRNLKHRPASSLNQLIDHARLLTHEPDSFELAMLEKETYFF